jgi:transposase-like protein
MIDADLNGARRCAYRAVDPCGQIIDVLVSACRDAAAARRFLRRALSTLKVTPSEVVTDAAEVHPGGCRKVGSGGIEPVEVASAI